MDQERFYAPPETQNRDEAEAEQDEILAQFGFDVKQEKIRWPHLVGASFLILNAVYTAILFLFGEPILLFWPIFDFAIGLALLLSKKRLYANILAFRGAAMILFSAPIVFSMGNLFEAITTLILGISLVCLCWRQPHAIRAWIGASIGGLYLLLFTLGLVLVLFNFPDY